MEKMVGIVEDAPYLKSTFPVISLR